MNEIAPENRSRLGYPLVDADNHFYETDDCFTRHLEAKFRDRAVHIVKGKDGLGRIYFGDKRMSFMRVTQSDYNGAPGSQRDLWEGRSDQGYVQSNVIRAKDFPEFMKRGPRLALMDQQGIEATLMFPSLLPSVEHEMHDDPEAACANLRSFNRYIEEEWGFDDGRIFSPAAMSLIDLDFAVTELERVLRRGARLLSLRPGPVYGRSPGDPHFDPFWARVAEAGVLVAMHSCDSGYNELWSVQWGEPPRSAIQHMSPFQWYLGFSGRPIADTLAALVLNNVFARFPGLKVLAVENGFAWLPGLLHEMDHGALLGSNGRALGGKLVERPSAVLRRHVWITPFPEEDPVALVELIGADHALFGSDYPHAEGLKTPAEFADKLIGRCSERDVRRVMRENAAELLKLASRGSSLAGRTPPLAG